MNKELKEILGIETKYCDVFKIINRADMEYDCEQITEELGCNKTTVQRAVKRLYELGLIKRSQTNLNGGGYLFRYSAKYELELKVIMMKIVKNKCEKLNKIIRNKEW